MKELIAYLQGTCHSLDQGKIDCGIDRELTTEEHAEIDQEIFQCEQCSWWCEQNENNNEGTMELCDDCESDNNPEFDEEEE